ncbi:DDE-type integrase/transposase/recombinase [Variovorax sp. J22R115]|uniref:DDE-type integrase/transposase/recombinase n=1 Tax=Variovorax sp. J22R115 TaxID=3053509 RepID=UPI002575193A|nr:DDE-type integrase/transposase/recombinase [Variovorax sp. J22R115]MDM0052996.1 DDE-type integrase/transposase/recombinase [Variovorax sp. J22R115]
MDFRLSANRDVKAAKAIFSKALATRERPPVTITLDGYTASHRAVRELSARPVGSAHDCGRPSISTTWSSRTIGA